MSGVITDAKPVVVDATGPEGTVGGLGPVEAELLAVWCSQHMFGFGPPDDGCTGTASNCGFCLAVP
jgi:hypothetical protein